MSELQDTINKIMNDPEAMRQVQSLGEKLGITNAAPAQPPPVPQPSAENGLSSALSKLMPIMSAAKPNDETAALLNALRPFLSGEKLERLQSAQKLVSLIRMIPLIKDSGLFL